MKIKFGALVVDGRNKIGGQVASKNKAGAYMKNKVTPANPNTSAQANARANLTSVSRAWAGLTSEQREAWNAYASQYPYVDIFGDSKYLTGFNYYLKCNLNLLNAGSSMVDTPPASQDVSEVVFNFQDLSAPGTISIISATATMPANTKVVCLASPGLSPGRVPAKSDLRQIKIASTLTTGLIDMSVSYTSRFGAITDGLNYGVGYFSVNTQTGLVSQLRSLSQISPIE